MLDAFGTVGLKGPPADDCQGYLRGMFRLPAADIGHQGIAGTTVEVGEEQQHRFASSPQGLQRDELAI
jgi:hypothetical protein